MDPYFRKNSGMWTEWERKTLLFLFYCCTLATPYSAYLDLQELKHQGTKPPRPVSLESRFMNQRRYDFTWMHPQDKFCSECRPVELECKKMCFDRYRSMDYRMYGFQRPRIQTYYSFSTCPLRDMFSFLSKLTTDSPKKEAAEESTVAVAEEVTGTGVEVTSVTVTKVEEEPKGTSETNAATGSVEPVASAVEESNGAKVADGESDEAAVAKKEDALRSTSEGKDEEKKKSAESGVPEVSQAKVTSTENKTTTEMGTPEATKESSTPTEVEKEEASASRENVTEKSPKETPKSTSGNKKNKGKKSVENSPSKNGEDLEKENEELKKRISDLTKRYEEQHSEFAQKRSEQKQLVSVITQLYQLTMGIDSNTPTTEFPKQRNSSSPKTQSSSTDKKGRKTQRSPGSAGPSSSALTKGDKAAVSPSSNATDKKSAASAYRRSQERSLQQLIAEAKARQAQLKSKRKSESSVVASGPNPESVREQLRVATTKKEVEDAINDAKKLNMTYELSLGEKKLNALTA
ncbi:merozoite surface protein, putative [Perkinsus marinus ATCC 50983]|uniref:Merozoite surface protein, putative n=1 Tax=Perkinsus marinus (strain ATCC 50983 / TXsc) TaxID=423536 RepID=C5KU93_PERM5|nr:merozoite surface protein, putative [Perkinsus marinus ATCC 50983]EER12135.1 merozoite surface protein, putative [Perkinsus marinus ATCC 50983]|eukprot:XP_002780340.1 merozoite surface protein, putative [Perkinsus marinus ATCC 50983]